MKHFLLVCYVLLLAACGGRLGGFDSADTHTPLSALTQRPTSTKTLTPTPTYIPITPVWQGTTLPGHGDVITVENIDRLTLLSRWGHGNPGDLAYTPDGKYFVVGASTGLYFYNADDLSLIHYIDTQAAVLDLAISPDSRTIAAVVTDRVILYDIVDLQLKSKIQINANSVDFSPDSQIMALGINSDLGYLQLHYVETGIVLETPKIKQSVWDVKISPRGDVIANAGFSTTIWSLDGSLLDQHGPYVSGGHTASVSFSPDGEFLAEGSDLLLRIWRVEENGQINIYRDIDLSQYDLSTIYNVAISPNGKMVAATLFAGVGIWDLASGDRIFFVDSINGYTFYNSLVWSMDNNTIAVTSRELGVQLWSVNTIESIASLSTHSGSLSSLVWSPDGEKLGAGAEEGIAYIFNAQNGKVTNQFGSGYELNSLAFSPDSQTLAVGYGNRTAQIWNMDGELLRTLEGFGYGSSDAAFSSDGSFFAATLPENWQAPPQVRYWNTNDWTVDRIFSLGNRDNLMITGFELSPDQSTGAISFVDMNGYHTDYIKIISITDGTTIATLEPKRKRYRVFIDSVAYSPNSKFLAALITEVDDPNPRILVWQTRDWTLLYEQEIIAGPQLGWSKHRQDALSWSPDSVLIAVGMKDGSIQIIKSIDGERITTLNGHTMFVTGVSFSPDGRILASISLDGTLMLWGLR